MNPTMLVVLWLAATLLAFAAFDRLARAWRRPKKRVFTIADRCHTDRDWTFISGDVMGLKVEPQIEDRARRYIKGFHPQPPAVGDEFRAIYDHAKHGPRIFIYRVHSILFDDTQTRLFPDSPIGFVAIVVLVSYIPLTDEASI